MQTWLQGLGVVTLALTVLSSPLLAATKGESSLNDAEKVLRQLFSDFVQVCTVDAFPDDPLAHELFELKPEPSADVWSGMGRSRMMSDIRAHWSVDATVFFVGAQRVTSIDIPVCGFITRRGLHLPLPYKKILSDTFPGNRWGTEQPPKRPLVKRFHGNHRWRKEQMQYERICLELGEYYVALFRATYCVIQY